MSENDFGILIHCTNNCVCECVYVVTDKYQFYSTSCRKISMSHHAVQNISMKSERIDLIFRKIYILACLLNTHTHKSSRDKAKVKEISNKVVPIILFSLPAKF